MRWLALTLLLQANLAWAQEPPSWFSESLLFISDEVADAAKQGKRVMIYFGQDGCPYCKQFMEVNLRQRPTVERMQKRFVAIALNIWGDREVTWVDGQASSEKDLARRLKVQFTPTLFFLDEKGGVALRVNGYYLPQRFDAALDQAAGLPKISLPGEANKQLNPQPFITDKRSGKPLVMLFETPHCSECDALHREVFTRAEVLAELKKFDVMRFPVSGKEARSHKVEYVPTLVLLDTRGREALRLEAYLRPFHVTGALDYVASGAHLKEPSFQRYLQDRADQMRERGQPVDLWK